jgi:RimJ/RimL family protein N-acetyltransferase
MKNLSQMKIVINTETQAKLVSLNEALAQVHDPLTHHMWCSSDLPFLGSLTAFNPGDEPIVSWKAVNLNGDFLGQIELHHNQFGWILARLWVKREWRRIGLARSLKSTALDYAFTRSDVVGAFCDTRNEASWNLQTSMGFRPIKLWADAKCKLLTVSKEDYEIYKLAIKPLLNLQKQAPATVSNPLHCDPSIPSRP